MIRPILTALLAAIAVLPSAAADAQSAGAYRVDDSGTVVVEPVLPMQWRPGGSSIVSASTRVNVQLNLAPWNGRSGRIYMTLPRGAGPTVRATWQTGGVMLPGTLLSGERALVYSGPIASALLRDLIDIRLEADSMRLLQPQALAFGFEIEVDP